MRTPDPRLNPAKEDAFPGVTRQATAESQALQASSVDTVEEWQALIEYFPNDPEWVPKAKYRIAALTLSSGRLREAEEILQELSEMGASNATAQAVADAGRAILSFEKKDVARARSQLAALGSSRGRLPNEMVELLRQVESEIVQ